MNHQSNNKHNLYLQGTRFESHVGNNYHDSEIPCYPFSHSKLIPQYIKMNHDTIINHATTSYLSLLSINNWFGYVKYANRKRKLEMYVPQKSIIFIL